jgi:hypothetical protein
MGRMKAASPSEPAGAGQVRKRPQPAGRVSLFALASRAHKWEALQLTLPRGPAMRHFPKGLALYACYTTSLNWRL